MYKRNTKYLFKKFNKLVTSNLTTSTIPSVTSNNTNSIYIDKPLGTGAGPFVELPKFKTIGNDGNLLQVVIPKSSSNLNIQFNSNSIIGINGSVTENLDLQVKNKYIPISGSIEYQELITNNDNDLNLFIQGNNYKLIELNKSQSPWIFLRDENLVGWIENFKLDFQPVEILQKFKSLQVKGTGYILINGGNCNDVIELNLNANEEILINPNSLIAINGNNINDVSFQLIPHDKLFEFKLPQIPSLPSLPLTHGIRNKLLDPVKSMVQNLKVKYQNLLSTTNDMISQNEYMKSLMNWVIKSYQYIYSKLFYNTEGFLLRRNPIFMKIKGPVKILMNNKHVTNNNKLFTNKEIKSFL